MHKSKYIKAQLLLSQLLAVFVWFLVSVVQWSKNPKNSPGIEIPLIVRGTEAVSVLIVSGILIFLIQRYRRYFKSIFSRVLLLIVFYFFALLTNVLSLAIRDFIGYKPPTIDGYFFIQSLHFYIPLLLVFVFYSIVRNRIELQSEREEKLRAESLAQQAKWMMLRYQVNPHFLFNALNSIRALIGYDDEKARKIVTDMSEYFRYSLSVEKKSLVPIYEEIYAVDNYLEIQKIRYHDRLIIEKEIDAGMTNCIIPVFSIQTLIENAVKYGLKTHEGQVRIKIYVGNENGKLKIQVSNTGKLINPEKEDDNSTNTGIENLKSRMQFVDKEFQFKLSEYDNTVLATLLLTNCKRYENVESNNN